MTVAELRDLLVETGRTELRAALDLTWAEIAGHARDAGVSLGEAGEALFCAGFLCAYGVQVLGPDEWESVVRAPDSGAPLN